MSQLPYLIEHLDDIYILYGFSFWLLGVNVFLQPREDRILPFSRFIYLIAWFGILHGSKELVEWVKISHPQIHNQGIIKWLDHGLLISSYLFLFEFGRRLLSMQSLATKKAVRQIVIPFWSHFVMLAGVGLFVLLAQDPLKGFDVGVRFFIGLVAAVFTGIGFINFYRNDRRVLIRLEASVPILVAAVAFILYGFLAGLVVNIDPGLPPIFINQDSLSEVLSIPVQALRTLCAITIAFSLAHVLRIVNIASRKNEQKALDKVILLNQRLEQRVLERTSELEQSNDSLRRAINESNIAQADLEAALDRLKASELKQRELAEAATLEQSRLYALLSAMNIGILFEDKNSCIEYINPSFRKIWTIPEDVELQGKSTQEFLNQSESKYSKPDHASRFVLQIASTHEISDRFEIELDDGRTLTQLSYPVLDKEDRILGRLWVYEDITNERQTAQQLLYLAERDALTGLYNRHRFKDQLEMMINSARRSNSRFCLVYFDLDEFKYINDNFGHSSGDTVLVRAANELSTIIRSDELLARVGGDEFAILSILQEGASIDALPQRIVRAISELPFHFRGQNMRLTASVGVALFPEHGTNVEELVAHADAAMYQAKQQGKNNYAIYDPVHDHAEAMVKCFTWNQRIAEALDKDLLELHFQGIYSTDNRRIQHVEALVRMRDAQQRDNLVMPSQFIILAEKSNTVVSIDRWVIQRSIQLLAQHKELSAIAVNLSGRTIDDPGLPNYIRGLLKSHDVRPERLILELTETTAVSDLQDAQRFIEVMQRLGCTVCLDDFGSGFATFSYLKHLRVDILKIDGQFIRDLSNNFENQAFVKAMVDVARGLRKKCIAEFVEDEATLSMLHELGVEFAQGYYLGRPKKLQDMINI